MLNKLDILSGLDPIRLCVAYEVDGRRVEALAVVGRRARRARRRSTRRSPAGGADPRRPRRWPTCPRTRAATSTALEEHAGVPIMLVSVGPERTQTIERAWRPMRHRPRRRLRRCAAAARDDAAGHADPDPGRRRRRREHALAWKLARASRASNEVVVAPGSDGDRAREPRVALRAGRRSRSTRDRRSSRLRPAIAAASSSSSGPEAPLAAGRRRRARGGRRRRLRAERGRRADRELARRSAARSPRRPGVPMAARPGVRRDDPAAAIAYATGLGADGAASSSRPTGSRPARA